MSGRNGTSSASFRPRLESDETRRDPEIARAVVRAQGGDREAARYLYLQYADSVYGYALSLVRVPHEAEDITQQVFLKMLTNIHRYQPREVPFAAWIVRIARNAAVDLLRERRQVPCEEVFAADTASDNSQAERRRGLIEALTTLPEDQRDVVVMRHVMGLTPPEIADRLGKSQPAVHGLHHRGRRALRAELTRLDEVPTAA